MFPPHTHRVSTLPRKFLLVLLVLAFACARGAASTLTVAYDPVDCTANLQAALDDPTADTVIVPFTGSPWTTGPLVLARSNVTVILQPGVVLLAANGAYDLTGSCLLQVQLCQNVTISGYGAILQMLNGTDSAYDDDENRHCLALRGVGQVLVEGLTCTLAGGDGIYISEGWGGTDPTYSGNVTIQDCTLDNNRRQGISVISAQDLLIQRCVMSNTGLTNGADPMAGIDFEPDTDTERLVRCTLNDCSMFGNHASDYNYGTGIHSYLGNLDSTSLPVSIQITRCHITSTETEGNAVTLSGPNDGGPATTFTMTDCLIEDTRGCGLYLNTGYSTTTTQITRTVLRNTFTDTVTWNNGGTPIYLEGQMQDIHVYGNITFTDCLVVDGQPRSFIRSYEDRSSFTPPLATTWCNGLRGNITVINPNAAGQVYNLDFPNDKHITLAVTALTAMPLQTVSVTALTPATSAGSATPATLVISRSATDLAFPLAVDLTWSGAAANGRNFTRSPDFIILPTTTTTAQIALTALSGEGLSAIATLTPRTSDYTVAPNAADATLMLFATPLPAWRFNIFGIAANSGSAADTADPDGDGLPNLLEYALGSNPILPDSAGVTPAMSASIPGQLQFSFPCDARCTDITYTVQASNDLSTWTDIASSTGGAATVAVNSSGAIISDSGTGRRIVTVTVPPTLPGTFSFLRLAITGP